MVALFHVHSLPQGRATWHSAAHALCTPTLPYLQWLEAPMRHLVRTGPPRWDDWGDSGSALHTTHKVGGMWLQRSVRRIDWASSVLAEHPFSCGE